MRIGGINDLMSAINPSGGAGSLTSPGANPMAGVEKVGGGEFTGLTPLQGPSSGPGFGEYLANSLEEVNKIQANADTMAQKLATGDVEDVHQVMLALSQASNAFGLTVSVRNKAIEAYQEIMRMQV